MLIEGENFMFWIAPEDHKSVAPLKDTNKMFSRVLDHYQAVNSNYPINEVKLKTPDLRLFGTQEEMEKTNPNDNFWGMKCIAKIKASGSCHIDVTLPEIGGFSVDIEDKKNLCPALEDIIMAIIFQGIIGFDLADFMAVMKSEHAACNTFQLSEYQNGEKKEKVIKEGRTSLIAIFSFDENRTADKEPIDVISEWAEAIENSGTIENVFLAGIIRKDNQPDRATFLHTAKQWELND